MEKKIKKNKAVVLFGPTAVGKTKLTEELFSTGYEIINADSIQVYKDLDIASAKPDKELQNRIKHYLVDIREPWEKYTSGDFVNDTNYLINDINSRSLTPLITGGTAYYFKMLCYGSALTPKSDSTIREKVSALLKDNGEDWIREELKRVDSVSSSRINKNDIYRITRALEVYYQTGKPLSSFPLANTLRDDVDFILIGLKRDKKELEERINKRVDIMFENGAIEEMRTLLNRGANSSWPSMEAIGYKEWLERINSGEYSINLVKNDIKHNSIKYAKRQMTFFSSFAEAKWFHPEDMSGIKNYLESRLSL